MELTARTLIIIAQTNSHRTNQNTQEEVISPSVYSVTRNMAGSEKLDVALKWEKASTRIAKEVQFSIIFIRASSTKELFGESMSQW